MNKPRGLILVLSGPSGSGKGTVREFLLKDENFAFSVSLTSRAPRQGEVDGVDYHYVTREEFEERIAAGDMMEYTEYCGNYYGTSAKVVSESLNAGKNVILEIEVEGAMNIRKKYPDSVLVMLLPPSFAEQEKGLRGRGTENEETIVRRLERTKKEMLSLPAYDYVVYNENGQVEACADRIRAIIAAEQSSLRRNPDTLKAYFADPS